MSCEICNGEGWVCEGHPDQKWNYGDPYCCGGAGMPCKCNTDYTGATWKLRCDSCGIGYEKEKQLQLEDAVDRAWELNWEMK